MENVYSKDPETLTEMNAAGIRKRFFKGLNPPIIKDIFHVLNCEINYDDIFTSAASPLYTTFYANMCAYVLQHRVRTGDTRTVADDKALFQNFKDIAKETAFSKITLEDLPLRPRKPANVKRMKINKAAPLSTRDLSFKFFGPPPGFKSRPPKVATPALAISDGSDDDDGIVEVVRSPETLA